jgi:hypothetical protein
MNDQKMDRLQKAVEALRGHAEVLAGHMSDHVANVRLLDTLVNADKPGTPTSLERRPSTKWLMRRGRRRPMSEPPKEVWGRVRGDGEIDCTRYQDVACINGHDLRYVHESALDGMVSMAELLEWLEEQREFWRDTEKTEPDNGCFAARKESLDDVIEHIEAMGKE